MEETTLNHYQSQNLGQKIKSVIINWPSGISEAVTGASGLGGNGAVPARNQNKTLAKQTTNTIT